MNLKMIECSSGPKNSYLAAQHLTGVNYVAPADGAFIRRIFSSVRVANREVFVYFADSATGSNASVIFHLADSAANRQSCIEDLWLYVPGGKYVLVYTVGEAADPYYLSDTTFSVLELESTEEFAAQTQRTYFVHNVPDNAYSSPILGNLALVAPTGGACIKRVRGMVTATNTVGYLYYADDPDGGNANVMRGYAGGPLYAVVDFTEDCMLIPAGKRLLARSEIGRWSVAVTVEFE